MFTGIITACVPITATKKDHGLLRVTLQRPPRWKLRRGESISIDGVCSTIISTTRTTFMVAYMPTTLRVTRFGTPLRYRKVNLERSLVFGDRLHGHFVTGHCDSRGRVRAQHHDGDSVSSLLTIIYPKRFQRLVIPKGSLAVNGVSLTIADCPAAGCCSVALIPTTLQKTNLGSLRVDDIVNLEYDLVAKIILKNSKHGQRF